ncbi:MAG: fumarylacetoacetate hydrolase family protein [Bacteroidota bacterium]|nr:fumarylacetoacetate hydrolase family protein [Bacteroidota bacterium]MDE2955854.1 fumarylacetoacetate hydrolase family protein [Bacteroidota bacterium]
MNLIHPDTGEVLRCGKVLCIGRNYAKHAAEMNHSVPSEPVVFLKPSTALVSPPDPVVLPALSDSVHHEAELVALIGQRCRNVAIVRALDYVAGYAVGLDMTARDLQATAKKRGHPWSVAKGFDTFAPLGSFVSSGAIADPQNLMLRLEVNGDTRQLGHTANMIFDVATLVAWCSTVFTLEPGDLLYTGTPDGVGPVDSGDALRVTCAPLPALEIRVA